MEWNINKMEWNIKLKKWSEHIYKHVFPEENQKKTQ